MPPARTRAAVRSCAARCGTTAGSPERGIGPTPDAKPTAPAPLSPDTPRTPRLTRLRRRRKRWHRRSTTTSPRSRPGPTSATCASGTSPGGRRGHPRAAGRPGGKVFPVSGGLPLAKRAPQRQAYRLVELKRWSDYLRRAAEPAAQLLPGRRRRRRALIIAVDLHDGTDAAMRWPTRPARGLGAGAQHRRRSDAGRHPAERELPARRLDAAQSQAVQERYEADTQRPSTPACSARPAMSSTARSSGARTGSTSWSGGCARVEPRAAPTDGRGHRAFGCAGTGSLDLFPRTRRRERRTRFRFPPPARTTTRPPRSGPGGAAVRGERARHNPRPPRSA